MKSQDNSKNYIVKVSSLRTCSINRSWLLLPLGKILLARLSICISLISIIALIRSMISWGRSFVVRGCCWRGRLWWRRVSCFYSKLGNWRNRSRIRWVGRIRIAICMRASPHRHSIKTKEEAKTLHHSPKTSKAKFTAIIRALIRKSPRKWP